MDEHALRLDELARLRSEVAALRAEKEALNPSTVSRDTQGEIQFHTLFKFFPVPTYAWRWNGANLLLVSYNDAAALLTKGDVESLIGKSSYELYFHDQRSVYDDMQRCLFERTSIRREYTYRMRSIVAQKDLVTTYVFVPPNYVMIHTEDVTERKCAETALRESEARYRTLFENAPIGL